LEEFYIKKMTLLWHNNIINMDKITSFKELYNLLINYKENNIKVWLKEKTNNYEKQESLLRLFFYKID
jgi:hypothetical protein